MFVILGTVTSVTGSNSSALSFSNSKYGNTSLSICEPIGAATPPPWVILTTQILQICYLFFQCYFIILYVF